MARSTATGRGASARGSIGAALWLLTGALALGACEDDPGFPTYQHDTTGSDGAGGGSDSGGGTSDASDAVADTPAGDAVTDTAGDGVADPGGPGDAGSDEGGGDTGGPDTEEDVPPGPDLEAPELKSAFSAQQGIVTALAAEPGNLRNQCDEVIPDVCTGGGMVSRPKHLCARVFKNRGFAKNHRSNSMLDFKIV